MAHCTYLGILEALSHFNSSMPGLKMLTDLMLLSWQYQKSIFVELNLLTETGSSSVQITVQVANYRWSEQYLVQLTITECSNCGNIMTCTLHAVIG